MVDLAFLLLCIYYIILIIKEIKKSRKERCDLKNERKDNDN